MNLMDTAQLLGNFGDTAQNLSPGDGQMSNLLGALLWARGDLDGAISELEKSLENMRSGLNYIIRAGVLAQLYCEDGQTERANQLLDTALRNPRHDTAGLAVLCLALARAGQVADLESLTAELVSEHDAHWFPGRAVMHLASGEMDEAFRYLDEGIEQRFPPDLDGLRAGAPWLTPMREDKRWQGVMTHLEDMEARAAAGE